MEFVGWVAKSRLDFSEEVAQILTLTDGRSEIAGKGMDMFCEPRSASVPAN